MTDLLEEVRKEADSRNSEVISRVLLSVSSFRIGEHVAQIDPFKHYAPHCFEIAMWLSDCKIPAEIIVKGVEDVSSYNGKFINPFQILRAIRKRIDDCATMSCTSWYDAYNRGSILLDNWLMQDFDNERDQNIAKGYSLESDRYMRDYVSSMRSLHGMEDEENFPIYA